jgi:hypothetical protein
MRLFRGRRTGLTPSATSNTDLETFEPWLLLHQSGVALLTVGVELPSSLRVDDLIPLLSANGLLFRRTVLAEPIIQAVSRAWGVKERSWVGSWRPELEEGVRWLDSGYDEDVSLVEIFGLYRDGIIQIARASDPGMEWLCYPTLLIDTLRCCGSQNTWRRQHLEELMGVVARVSFWRQVPSHTERYSECF